MLLKFYVIQIMYTAIPYRASTGPEQGFPRVVFPHREKPFFNNWVFSVLNIWAKEGSFIFALRGSWTVFQGVDRRNTDFVLL